MKQIKTVDTGLDVYVLDADTNETIGKATFEQEYQIEENYFNTMEEWREYLHNNYFTIEHYKIIDGKRHYQGKLNKFYVYQQDKETKNELQLGDIISWFENKLPSKRYMIYKTASNKIGLLDTRLYVAYREEFDNLKELSNHFRTKAVDDNKINVLDREDWCIYRP